MTTEGYVQVATDGSGKKVANVAFTSPIPAATPDLPDVPTTVYGQKVTIVDSSGAPVDFTAMTQAIADLTEQVIAVSVLIKLAIG